MKSINSLMEELISRDCTSSKLQGILQVNKSFSTVFEQFRLQPIFHGLTLPTNLDIRTDHVSQNYSCGRCGRYFGPKLSFYGNSEKESGIFNYMILYIALWIVLERLNLWIVGPSKK